MKSNPTDPNTLDQYLKMMSFSASRVEITIDSEGFEGSVPGSVVRTRVVTKNRWLEYSNVLTFDQIDMLIKQINLEET